MLSWSSEDGAGEVLRRGEQRGFPFWHDEVADGVKSQTSVERCG